MSKPATQNPTGTRTRKFPGEKTRGKAGGCLRVDRAETRRRQAKERQEKYEVERETRLAAEAKEVR